MWTFRSRWASARRFAAAGTQRASRPDTWQPGRARVSARRAMPPQVTGCPMPSSSGRTTEDRIGRHRSWLVGSLPCRPLFVHRLWVKDLLADDFPLARRLVLAIEATVISVVAGRPDLLDSDQQHVLIAIDANALDVLHVAAAFPFE